MDIVEVYNNCRDKHGWGDGDNAPDGVSEVRDEIVSIINKLLPIDCGYSAVPFDRPGLHNSALIVYKKGDNADDRFLTNASLADCPDIDIEMMLYEYEEKEEIQFIQTIEMV